MVTSTPSLGSEPATSLVLRRTVVVVDMVGYSSIARMLEENTSALSVADLNSQIQSFMMRSLDRLESEPAYWVLARTGDGIIVLFERPDDAHSFAKCVHLLAKEHNAQRSERSAERWFRVGIATGDVIACTRPGHLQEFAGITIANAVRLEAAAEAGEIIVDTCTFEVLSSDTRNDYGAEELIRGKRAEQFRVRRFCVTAYPRNVPARDKAFRRKYWGLAGERPLVGLNVSKWWMLAPGLWVVVCLGAGSLFFSPLIGDRLRGWRYASHEKHIAVLPFQVAASDPGTRAIGDGLMDSLVGQLANLDSAGQAMWVVPAGDVRSLGVKDPYSALRAFGATIVIEGVLTRTETGACLQLSVIDPSKRRQVGLVTSCKPDDLASLQEDALRKLVPLLGLPLGVGTGKEIGGSSVRTAYQEYLAGVGYFERRDKAGNLDLAISSLEKAVEIDPSFTLGFAKLSEACLLRFQLTDDKRWLDRAEEAGGQAAALSSQIPSTYVALAQVHQATGNEELALQEYEKALSLEPADTSAMEGVANSLVRQGRMKEAEAAYLKRVALRPDDWSGYNALGNFYLDAGRPSDAVRQFNKGLDLAPENSWLLIGLASAYSYNDEPAMLAKAEAALRKSIEANPTFVAYNNLSLLYLQLHRFEESVSASEEALHINSGSAEVWANLAAAYEWSHLDDKAERARQKAIELYDQTIKEHPKNAMAHANLAELYSKEGNSARANEEIAISLALAPQNQYVLLEIADAFETMKNRKMALKHLREALKLGLPASAIRSDPEIQPVASSIR